MEQLVIVDVESTGLKAPQHDLLEVSFLFLDAGLNNIGQAHWLMPEACANVEAAYEKADDFVRTMHTKNNLWQDLYIARSPGGVWAGQQVTNSVAFDQMLKTLAAMGVTPNSRGVIVGRNPTFDLRWFEAYCPEIETCFSHQKIDIVAFQKTVQVKFGKDAAWKNPNTTHRARQDCLDELTELRYYTDNYLGTIAK